ncbi:hypothetical protein V8F06_013913 [Rhypophila decipiens]
MNDVAPSSDHTGARLKRLEAISSNPGSKETTIIPYGHDFEAVLIPRLLILHKYGLFFISWQRKQAPGSVEQLQDSEVWEERKRAQYVEFFIPHRTASKNFIEALLTENQLQITGSSENDIEVAWYRESSSQEDLTDAGWEVESFIPATHDCSNYEDLAEIEAFYKEKPVFCSITSLGDEVDLLELIEGHAKAADLEMDTELMLNT